MPIVLRYTSHHPHEHPPPINLPRSCEAAPHKPICDATDVPDELFDRIGQFHGIAWLNLVHCAENGRFDLGIIRRLPISPLKSVAPQNVTTPDDEVAFAPSFTPH